MITNSRCLTEGVDVPNIDCIVFADPRKSKVDIVQALGRALRKKQGKDWGYVVLPVVYNHKTHEIDNDNFQEILNIVRGLAANDERIIEEFKDKSQKSGRITGEREEIFSIDPALISETDLVYNLNINLWENLSRFNWMPFEEAREIVWSLKLKNLKEWTNYSKSKKKPINIPYNPSRVYKDQYISLMDWLGIVPGWDGTYLNYLEAKEIVRKLGLKSQNEWREYAKSSKKPYDIPAKPSDVYKKEFEGFGAWLGTGRISDNLKRQKLFLSYKDAIQYLKPLEFDYISDYRKWCKEGKRPEFIPSVPEKVYKDDNFKWSNFLSNDKLIPRKEKIQGYLTFNKARRYMRSQGLKNLRELQRFTKSKKFPSNIPKDPKFYKEYKNLGDWIGTDRVGNRNRSWMSFEDARKYVRSLGLKSGKEWLNYISQGKKPIEIPSNPNQVYKEFKGMGDWLGTYTIQTQKREYLSFKKAKVVLSKENMRTSKDWREFCKSNKRPLNIPSDPDRKYEDEWKGWADFLGKEN